MGQHDLSREEFNERGLEAIANGRINIFMFEDTDGNWRGMLHKDGKLVQSRAVGPETVLQELLTHDGK